MILLRQAYQLVILLTGGICGDKPNVLGEYRIHKACEIAERDGCSILVIGGQRLQGSSEAEVYSSFIRSMNPKLSVDFSAEGRVDLENVVLANGKISYRVSSGSEIAVVSNSRHARRMILTLRWLGHANCRVENSAEPATELYSAKSENLLYLLTAIDPGFRWLGKWILLRYAANRMTEACDQEDGEPN